MSSDSEGKDAEVKAGYVMSKHGWIETDVFLSAWSLF